MMRERLHEYEKYAQVPNVRYAKNAYGRGYLAICGYSVGA